uniref:Restriction endonuclease subunit S n=1 Tax=Heterorhabditis bacteriophora TaxID=37862 RepID=A0A1I7XJU3_HETBA
MSLQDSQLLGILRSRQHNVDQPEWVGSYSSIVKKYDRNCFFSPVQCMLSFNQEDANPFIFATKGKRLFYYKK